MTATPPRRPPRRATLGAMLAAVAMLALTGCESVVHTRGNLPSVERVAEIQPGRSNRADIEELLGTPSTRAVFDKEIWLYIGSRDETRTFAKPKLLERRILTIRFNKRGIVEELRTYDATSGRLVQLVERETPTKGKELSFIEQLIGNVGRFDNAAADKESPY